MIFKIINLFFFLVLLKISYSFNHEIDSNKRVLFPKDYGEKKWKIIVGLDARRSYFHDQKVKINGLRLGAQYRGVHRFGFGFYALSESIFIQNVIIDQQDALQPTTLRINVDFTTLFYERVLYKVPKWEVSIPIYLGSGKLRSEYINNLGNYKTLSKAPFSVLGFGISAKYYIFKWIAPRVTFGHRLTYNTNKDIRKAFNKPFYSFGVSISPVELYKSLIKKDK
jgi:hypothetical protein